ncbi:MAG: ABC transporter permease [bacterium]
MKKQPIIKSGFRTMARYKLRTFFMMLGTVIISIGKGTEKKIMDKIERMFDSSSMFIAAGGGRMGGPRSGPNNTLTLDDIKALEAEIDNIRLSDPMQVPGEREVKYKEKGVSIRIIAHSPNAEMVWNRSVTSGAFFTDEENENNARVVLIGEVAAKELFGETDPLDEQIRIGNVPFRIKGILEPIGIDVHGLDRDNEIHVPITTAMRRLMNVDYISGAKLIVKDPDKIEQNEAQIEAILRERHQLANTAPNDFHIMTPIAVQEMVAEANKVFTVFLPLIAGVALLVGGIVIANLMLITVNERTGEIGLRKAVGACSNDILLQFIAESTVITLVAGILGTALGFAGMQVVAKMMELPLIISWHALLLGLVVSTAVGLIAGVFPARRAAAFDPVTTLR